MVSIHNYLCFFLKHRWTGVKKKNKGNQKINGIERQKSLFLCDHVSFTVIPLSFLYFIFRRRMFHRISPLIFSLTSRSNMSCPKNKTSYINTHYLKLNLKFFVFCKIFVNRNFYQTNLFFVKVCFFKVCFCQILLLCNFASYFLFCDKFSVIIWNFCYF